MSSLIKLPLNKFFNIWKQCYKFNPEKGDILDKLDAIITKRGIVVQKDGEISIEFVQISQKELDWIKNLYEQIF